eukprot:7381819-Prymnesium_polylepis.2
MPPPPKTPARRQRAPAIHPRCRRPSQADRLKLRSLLSSRRFPHACRFCHMNKGPIVTRCCFPRAALCIL